LVDNKFDNFVYEYQTRLKTISKSVKDQEYKSVLGVIDGISVQISKDIYHPFTEEQKFIENKLLDIFHSIKNDLSDVSPWLDIIVFIKKYNFVNIRNEIFGYIYENYLKELYEEEQKGQYFTDPAVVNFMLEQVKYNHPQIEYKVNNNMLDKLSVIDPACGSGTFLYSAASEIINSFPIITKDTSKQIEEIITNNLFGLDIEEFPLYLAEMSILMRLLPLIIGAKYNNPLDKKLKVFLTSDSIVEFMHTGIEKSGTNSGTQGGQKSFFDKIIQPTYTSYMRDEENLTEMKGSMLSSPRKRFDYVIANPPYISYNASSKQGQLVLSLIKNKQVKLNDIYGVNLHSVPNNPKRYRPNPNLYAFFIALGLSLLKDDGKLCYIVPQTFLINADLDVLRFHLSKNVSIEKMIIFSGKMFIGRGLKQNRPVPTSSLILIASRKPPTKETEVEIVNYLGSEDNIENIFMNISNGDKITTKKFLQSELLNKVSNWNFIKLNENQLKFLEKYDFYNDDISKYYNHILAKKFFNNTFIFDGGYGIDETKLLQFPPDKPYYECPKLNNKYWTIKENCGYWPNNRVSNEDMFIELRQGSQGYSLLDTKYKIIWSYNATEKFFYTEKPIIWARNKILGISSDDQEEIYYLFALLNSNVTKYFLDNLVKIAQEDTRTILVSLQIIKTQIKIPKITPANEPLKKEIIKQVEQLIKCENTQLSTFVDFSGILLQQFDDVKVEGNILCLEHDQQTIKLKIQGNINLVAESISALIPTRNLKISKISLDDIRSLPIIDSQRQAKIKTYIDNLVFALYFNVPLKNPVIENEENIKTTCALNDLYETVNAVR
jgi:hypothetical protein